MLLEDWQPLEKVEGCPARWSDPHNGTPKQNSLRMLLASYISALSSRLLNLSHYTVDAAKTIVDNKVKVTKDHLRAFLDICWTKYVKAKVEPGDISS